eukprot:COSAG06_NODE_52619_length_304_cov_1.507317_1_plen_27_part_10
MDTAEEEKEEEEAAAVGHAVERRQFSY